jgi:hypothetical protein
VFAQDKDIDILSGKDAWQTFRDARPGHFQGWIIAGKGPAYTLIFAEPPPVFANDEIEKIFRETFRGYVALKQYSRMLGFNGTTTDLSIDLDYSFAGANARRELDVDLRTLSTAIYGTAYGAKAFDLRDLKASVRSPKVPENITVNGQQIENWLLNPQHRLMFASPERGYVGNLPDLINKVRAGRLLAVDNSLVVLLVDLKRSLLFSDVTNIRNFVLDSDLILGGVVDDKSKVAIVIGRARQVSWIDFPPLRVEDILTLISTKDDELAQSYDRTSPGAGRIELAGSKLDWAPSFLSAGLINTEFGSLLNHADAILKSQSLANTIRYRGYNIEPLKEPPYPEGVYGRLQKTTDLTSLIFNFNTVGAGYWLEGGQTFRIFSAGSTGSFSVTFSPDTTGEASLASHTADVSAAEQAYTEWFAKARNPTLMRTVQYMTIYQIFKGQSLSGPDISAKLDYFNDIGTSLRLAVEDGLKKCLDRPDSDTAVLPDVTGSLSELSPGVENTDIVPTTSKMLLDAAVKAAQNGRYQANLYGQRGQYLEDKYQALYLQGVTLYQKVQGLEGTVLPKFNQFKATYKKYEDGIETVEVNGQKIKKTRYLVPPNLSSRFNSEKRELEPQIEELVKNQEYLDTIGKQIIEAGKDRDQYFENLYTSDLLVRIASQVCDGRYGTNQSVFDSFNATSRKLNETSGLFNSLVTPTVVMSQNADLNFTGGHDVARQDFSVILDKSLTSKSFNFVDGKLHISSSDANRMSEIATSLARVKNADPLTQTRAFDKAMASPDSGALGRLDALKISGKVVDGFALMPNSAARIPELAANSIRIGWQDRGMYLDQMVDGSAERVSLIGAQFGLPQLIASRTAESRIGRVVFDRSVSAQHRDQIIDDFVRERPAAGGSGGDGGNGRWRILGSSPDEPRRGPRILIFIDEHSKNERIVAETSRGRVELLVAKDADRETLIKALSHEIESGANIELNTPKVWGTQFGREIVVTGFEIRQAKPIKGFVAAFRARSLGEFTEALAEKMKAFIQGAFARVARSPKGENTLGDALVEIKSSLIFASMADRVSAKVRVDGTIIRFVLTIEKADRKLPG